MSGEGGMILLATIFRSLSLWFTDTSNTARPPLRRVDA